MSSKIRYENVKKRIIKYEIDDKDFCITNCPEYPESKIKVGSHMCKQCDNFIIEKDEEVHCFVINT